MLRRSEIAVLEEMKDHTTSAHTDLISLYEKTRQEFNGTLLKLDAETALADIYESMSAEIWNKKFQEVQKTRSKQAKRF